MLLCSGDHDGVGNAQGIHQWRGEALKVPLACLTWTMIGRPANPETSVGGMALQRPAKPIGSTGDCMVLPVTHSWRGLPAVKSASGVGAGAWEQAQWAMGSCAGRLSRGSIDGSRGANPTLGEGAPVKLSSCWGVAWNDGWTGVRDRSVETAGLGCGLQDGLDEIR